MLELLTSHRRWGDFGVDADALAARWADLDPLTGPAAVRSFYRLYAEKIGLAFQIADDILDVESTPEALGKATQKDREMGKATFVDLLGMDEAKRRAASLVEEAIAAVAVYGTKAEVLSDAARFIVARKS